MKKILLIIITIFLLTACNKETIIEEETHITTEEELREKVGKLFVIRPDSLDLTISIDETQNTKVQGVITVSDSMKETYEQYPCGGFCIFAKNIDSPDQLKTFTNELHSLNDNILIFVDEEGGLVSRLANNSSFDLPKFPNMQDIANTKDSSIAYNLGKTIGAYLNEYGIDGDFAPVADVNTNPKNPIIGVRAFGDDPEVAGEMVFNVVKGLHESGTLSCLKHFPGHGDTSTDTHLGYAETLKTWDELKQCEMIPFIKGIEAGSDLIMIAHISAPNVTGNNDPSTLSYLIVTEKLRNELGYDGVIIADSLEMESIASNYNAGEAAIRAIEAGIDLILLPDNYVEAFEAILNAIKEGRISEERIDQSIARIQNLYNK